MPAPNTPSISDKLDTLTAEVQAQSLLIQSQTLAIQALEENLIRVANYQRFMAESMFGATPSSAGIWDGTDRYTP